MEFASEMVIKAVLAGMRISNLPITLRPDGEPAMGRICARFATDGAICATCCYFLRRYLFVLPGAICMLLGLLPLIFLGRGPAALADVHFDYHYMILGSLMTILGFQAVMTGLFAKAYCHAARLYAPDRMLEAFRRHFSLERGLILGTALLLAGFILDARILIGWLRSGMGALNAIRPATRASTLMIIGAQINFSSFFMSLLGMFPSDADDPPPIAIHTPSMNLTPPARLATPTDSVAHPVRLRLPLPAHHRRLRTLLSRCRRAPRAPS